MKIIFLDIDGVLNNHIAHKNYYCGSTIECVDNFNSILEYHDDAKIIISSAWRYLIHKKHMTIVGFENLLLTHGVDCYQKILDCTRKDYQIYEPRENQILEKVYDLKLTKWIAIDDLELNLGDKQIKTVSETGLTTELAKLAIERLK